MSQVNSNGLIFTSDKNTSFLHLKVNYWPVIGQKVAMFTRSNTVAYLLGVNTLAYYTKEQTNPQLTYDGPMFGKDKTASLLRLKVNYLAI